MGRIKMLLCDARHPEAVSLLRAARSAMKYTPSHYDNGVCVCVCVCVSNREVWPGAEFGTAGVSVDEEMEIMREILYNPVAGRWLD